MKMKMMVRTSTALLLALTPTAVAASVVAQQQQQQQQRKLQTQTIAQLAADNPDLSVFVDTVVAVNLLPVFQNQLISLTLFAPVNQAFTDASQELIDLLTTLSTAAYAEHLSNLLLYHATDGQAFSNNLSNGQKLTMVNGDTLTVTVSNNGADIVLSNPQGATAAVIAADVAAANGVVRLIGDLLIPSFVYRRTIDLSDEYSSLLSLTEMAGLDDAIRNSENTVLAPNNQAFVALGSDTITFLTSNAGIDRLEQILMYHVLGSVVTSDKLPQGSTTATTLEGSTLSITRIDSGTFTVNNEANVVQLDILARNGVTHGIDAVLTPPVMGSPTRAPTNPPTNAPTRAPTTRRPTAAPTLESPTLAELVADTAELSTLYAALIEADLVPLLSNPVVAFTVFAPLDEAFEALNEGVLGRLFTPPFYMHLRTLLANHVYDDRVRSTDLSDGQELSMVSGEIVKVGIDGDGQVSLLNSQGVAAVVVGADNRASNGVVHAVNGVILPAFVYRTIIDSDDTYLTLLTLIELAGLAETLRGGPYTLFAPTNEAFNKLPAETLEFLTSPDGKETLTTILSYHVLGGVFIVDQLENGASATTLQGESVMIGIVGDIVTVNDAVVVNDDILAINGVTHGISSVLSLPVEKTEAPTMAPTMDSTIDSTSNAGTVSGTSCVGLLALSIVLFV
jgi:uncharacterized surface protein with fasciclin (FAS1) repeats